MNIAGIDYESVKEADGVSCVIYVSGCRHGCKGCHSPQTHDFNYGVPMTEELIFAINKEIEKRPFLSALVLCGGDPMYSAKELIEVIPKLNIPHGNLWCYTGFTIGEVENDFHMKQLLDMCTVLVDGRFEIENKDITIPYRGSTNQHMWVKKDGKWESKEE